MKPVSPTVISSAAHTRIIKSACGFSVVTNPLCNLFGPLAMEAVGKGIGERGLKDVDTTDISLPEAWELVAKIEKFFEMQEKGKR